MNTLTQHGVSVYSFRSTKLRLAAPGKKFHGFLDSLRRVFVIFQFSAEISCLAFDAPISS